MIKNLDKSLFKELQKEVIDNTSNQEYTFILKPLQELKTDNEKQVFQSFQRAVDKTLKIFPVKTKKEEIRFCADIYNQIKNICNKLKIPKIKFSVTVHRPDGSISQYEEVC